MGLAEIKDRLTGEWTGTKLLRLGESYAPDSTSPSHLAVAVVAMGKFLMFRYTWSHGNVPQEGLIVLGYDDGQQVATAAWIDSWHMSAKILSCEGTINDEGVIALKGFYEAPPDPDWGWRITITQTSETELLMVMHNCSPEGVDELAVRAEYSRQK